MYIVPVGYNLNGPLIYNFYLYFTLNYVRYILLPLFITLYNYFLFLLLRLCGYDEIINLLLLFCDNDENYDDINDENYDENDENYEDINDDNDEDEYINEPPRPMFNDKR